MEIEAFRNPKEKEETPDGKELAKQVLDDAAGPNIVDIERETLRQICLYKAIAYGDLEKADLIRRNFFNHDKLNKYLCEGFEPEDLHLFVKDALVSIENDKNKESSRENSVR